MRIIEKETMMMQCPHCKTRLLVEENDIKGKRFQVTCAGCKKKFVPQYDDLTDLMQVAF